MNDNPDNPQPEWAAEVYKASYTQTTVTVDFSLERKGGFVAMWRAAAFFDIVSQERNHKAFILLSVIAVRVRYPGSQSTVHGLGVGECVIGDFKNYGLTEQEYRTAKAKLAKWGFATFTGTGTGTRVKLHENPIFECDYNPAKDAPSLQRDISVPNRRTAWQQTSNRVLPPNATTEATTPEPHVSHSAPPIYEGDVKPINDPINDPINGLATDEQRLTTKEQKNNKREEPLRLKDAIRLYEHDQRFEHKAVKRSLSTMFREKGNIQFPSAIEGWLERERDPNPKPKRQNAPEPEDAYSVSNEEFLAPGPATWAKWEEEKKKLAARV